MRHAIVILILIIPYSNYCQSVINKKEAVQIAIDYGIAEPLDSFEVTLKNDTIWEVKSLFCDDYHHSQSEIYNINAITGEKYEENLGILVIVDANFNGPKTNLNYYGYVDSLLPVNKHKPKLLVSSEFNRIDDIIISPDNRWIVFNYNYNSIGIIGIDGRNFRKICDSCYAPSWKEKENILFYVDNSKQIYYYDIITDNASKIRYNYSLDIGYGYCPTGKWLAYVKAAPRKSENPNEIIVPYRNQAHELFVFSLQTGREKRITYEGYVSALQWKSTGDTLFFYMNDLPYYAIGFEDGSPRYGYARHLHKITIQNYTNCINGRFPYINHCQILLVNLANMKPVKFILKKWGRYNNIRMSNDGKFIVYTLEKQHNSKIFFIEIEN
jgi:tricorn protease-like protein